MHAWMQIREGITPPLRSLLEEISRIKAPTDAERAAAATPAVKSYVQICPFKVGVAYMSGLVCPLL